MIKCTGKRVMISFSTANTGTVSPESLSCTELLELVITEILSYLCPDNN